MPEVSVLIPTHNRRELLAEALQSVREQTCDSLECIVVDGASTDGTAAFLEQLEDDWLSVVRHDLRRGVAAARNTAIEHADGTYALFLDSDDLLYPHAAERLVSVLDGQPEMCAGAFSAGHRVTRHDRVISQSVPEGEMSEATLENARAIGGQTGTIFRRKVLDKIGGFDETLPSREDLDLYIRVLKCFSLFGVDEQCWVRRMHTDQLSDDHDAVRKANRRLADKN